MAGVGNPAARLIGRFPSMTPYSPGVPKRLPELPPSRVVSFRGPCGRTAFPVSPCQVLARKSLPGRGMSGSPRIYVGTIADTTGVSILPTQLIDEHRHRALLLTRARGSRAALPALLSSAEWRGYGLGARLAPDQPVEGSASDGHWRDSRAKEGLVDAQRFHHSLC
jgi:hypothetical protein